MQPFILDAATRTRNVFDQNQPMLNQLQSRITNNLPLLSQQAFGAQPGVAQAQGYATDVLGGKYLGQGNPYMNQMLDQTRQNVGNAVNSTFSMAGRTGGGNHAERAGQGMANAENQLRYQDYSAERDRMGQAGALVPSLTAAQYAGISPYLQATQTAANLPYAGLGALSPLLGAGAGAGQSTQSQPSDTFGSIMGLASAALPFIFSDERLKDNIAYTGRSVGGVPEVEFEYRKDSGLPQGRQTGFIAQDVAKLRPDALGPVVGGYLTINPEVL
jgi:hypothetical protein